MVCESRILNQVDLSAAYQPMLIEGIKALGMEITDRSYVGRFQDNADIALVFTDTNRERIGSEPFIEYRLTKSGKLLCPAGYEAMGDRVRRAYALQVVKKVSKRYGFRAVQKTENKLQLRKRV